MATGTEIAARLRELADEYEDISDSVEEHQLSLFAADNLVDGLAEELGEIKEQIEDLDREEPEEESEEEADE